MYAVYHIPNNKTVYLNSTLKANLQYNRPFILRTQNQDNPLRQGIESQHRGVNYKRQGQINEITSKQDQNGNGGLFVKQ